MFPSPQAVASFSLSPSFVLNFVLLSLTLLLVLFCHILVFSHSLLLSLSPPPSFLLFLCRVLWFPKLHVSCPCSVSVSGETHIVHLTAATWGWKKKKKEKSTRSKHCTSRVLAGLKKRRRWGRHFDSVKREGGNKLWHYKYCVCVSLAAGRSQQSFKCDLEGMRDWDGYLI